MMSDFQVKEMPIELTSADEKTLAPILRMPVELFWEREKASKRRSLWPVWRTERDAFTVSGPADWEVFRLSSRAESASGKVSHGMGAEESAAWALSSKSSTSDPPRTFELSAR